MRTTALTAIAAALALSSPAGAQGFTVESDAGTTLQAEPVAEFDEPWAMTFLPDGGLLVTEKPGTLVVLGPDGQKSEVGGVPEVAYGGQGGLGDVILHPDFAENGTIYLSYAEPGAGGRGAAVARATLSRGASPVLQDLEVIWRQQPKVSGNGHYSHRLAFSPDGEHLFIASGDRQRQTPAQDMAQNLGKIVRLNPDGSVPADNPYQDAGELARSYWSIGHRNILGIDFGPDGRLWAHEMGPRGGDEINLIEPGLNYGWPVVSNGRNYSGSNIPDHDTRPEFAAPEASWTPVIAPSGLVIYQGGLFSDWQGDALIGGLRSRALIRVDLAEQTDGTMAAEVERFDMGARIREVEQGPEDALWVLEDGDGGRLLRLTPGGD